MLLLLAAVTAGTAVLGGAFLLAQSRAGNFHAIVAGQAYRSAQPTVADVSAYQRQFGIRTIINLRDGEPQALWRKEEAQAASALGIAYVEFPMSARSKLSLDRSKQLIEVLQQARKPMLIHCKAGSDRTGLASALYLAATGATERIAEAQLSVRYGHFGIPYLGTYEMDQTFETMEPYLGFAGS